MVTLCDLSLLEDDPVVSAPVTVTVKQLKEAHGSLEVRVVWGGLPHAVLTGCGLGTGCCVLRLNLW